MNIKISNSYAGSICSALFEKSDEWFGIVVTIHGYIETNSIVIEHCKSPSKFVENIFNFKIPSNIIPSYHSKNFNVRYELDCFLVNRDSKKFFKVPIELYNHNIEEFSFEEKYSFELDIIGLEEFDQKRKEACDLILKELELGSENIICKENMSKFKGADSDFLDKNIKKTKKVTIEAKEIKANQITNYAKDNSKKSRFSNLEIDLSALQHSLYRFKSNSMEFLNSKDQITNSIDDKNIGDLDNYFDNVNNKSNYSLKKEGGLGSDFDQKIHDIKTNISENIESGAVNGEFNCEESKKLDLDANLTIVPVNTSPESCNLSIKNNMVDDTSSCSSFVNNDTSSHNKSLDTITNQSNEKIFNIDSSDISKENAIDLNLKKSFLDDNSSVIDESLFENDLERSFAKIQENIIPPVFSEINIPSISNEELSFSVINDNEEIVKIKMTEYFISPGQIKLEYLKNIKNTSIQVWRHDYDREKFIDAEMLFSCSFDSEFCLEKAFKFAIDGWSIKNPIFEVNFMIIINLDRSEISLPLKVMSPYSLIKIIDS